MRNYMKKYSMDRRDRAIGYLGGECVGCGVKDDVCTLQIHHKDPTTKSFTLAARWHRPWEETVAELEKCELLCVNCHRDHHRSKHPHGTVQRYWRKCRCFPCKAANAKHNREYKKRRKQASLVQLEEY